MHYLRQLLVLSFIVPSNFGWACTCLGFDYFCDALAFSRQYYPASSIVVRGIKIEDIKVNEYQTDMILEITESYRNTRRLSNLRVIDGNGLNCQQSVVNFPLGTELIIHAYVSEDPDTGELLGSISSCEPAPLRVQGGKVTGDISAGIQSLSLSRFRELNECAISPHIFKILNSPDEDKITLDLLGGPTGPTFLSVYDFGGKELLKRKFEFLDRQYLDVSTAALPTGIYLLQLRSEEGYSSQRFLVSR